MNVEQRTELVREAKENLDQALDAAISSVRELWLAFSCLDRQALAVKPSFESACAAADAVDVVATALCRAKTALAVILEDEEGGNQKEEV